MKKTRLSALGRAAPWVLCPVWAAVLYLFLDGLYPPGSAWAGGLALGLLAVSGLWVLTALCRRGPAAPIQIRRDSAERDEAHLVSAASESFPGAPGEAPARFRAGLAALAPVGDAGLTGACTPAVAGGLLAALALQALSLGLARTGAWTPALCAALWVLPAALTVRLSAAPETAAVPEPVPTGPAPGGPLAGALEWRDVTAGPLRRVSFRLSGGVTVVLGDEDGRFGRLSAGLETPEEGIIYYGNTPIDRISPVELHKKVLVLTGEEALPPAPTVADLLGAWGVEERVLLRELGLQALVLAAGGYRVPPARLSHQARLLARMALAVAQTPRLLILDGLLEGLDETSAQRVLASALRRGVDCAVVTRRETLPLRFDRVLVFRGGVLLFQGGRDEFMTWEETENGRERTAETP